MQQSTGRLTWRSCLFVKTELGLKLFWSLTISFWHIQHSTVQSCTSRDWGENAACCKKERQSCSTGRPSDAVRQFVVQQDNHFQNLLIDGAITNFLLSCCLFPSSLVCCSISEKEGKIEQSPVLNFKCQWENRASHQMKCLNNAWKWWNTNWNNSKCEGVLYVCRYEYSIGTRSLIS